MLYDLEREDWSDEILAAAGLSRFMLPDLYDPTTVFDAAPHVSARVGLDEGCKVVLGAMDNCCAVLGATDGTQRDLVNITGTYEHMAGVTSIDRSHRVVGEVFGGLVFRYVWPDRYLVCSRTAVGYLLRVLADSADGSIDRLLGDAAGCEPVPVDNALTEDAVLRLLREGRRAGAIAQTVLHAATQVLDDYVRIWQHRVDCVARVRVIGGGSKPQRVLAQKAEALKCRLALLNHSESASIGALRLAAVATEGATVTRATALYPNGIIQEIQPANARSCDE
jgi:sugar (pentulose or hexulose) kinase